VGPVVLGEERHFFGSPTALGADGEGEVGGSTNPGLRIETWGTRVCGATSKMRGFFPFGKLSVRMTKGCG
jgi:hypothetical protein